MRPSVNGDRRPGGQRLRPAGVFHGWWMVGALSFTELLSWGCLYFAFAALLVPMQGDLGWSRSFLSAGVGLAILVSGLAAPVVGRLADRHGARWLMTAGSLIGTAALLLWASATSQPVYLAAFVLVGLAMALTFYEPAFVLVATWFRRGVSRALLVITIGGGFASTVFLPITSALEDALGWRQALVVLAVGYGVLTGLPHALILRGRPERYGLRPDGADPEPVVPGPPGTTGHAAPPDGLSVRQATRDPSFWWLLVAFMLSMMATGAITVHLVAYLLDAGYGASFAALMAGLVGAMAVVGRILITATTRLLPRGTATAAVLGLQSLGIVVLSVWPATPGVVVFVALFGATAGALVIVRAGLIADYFGRRSYGEIAGLIAMGATLARSGGPVLAGLLYGLSGSYAIPFRGLAVATAVAALLMLVAGRQRSARLERASAAGRQAAGLGGPAR